MFRKNNVPAMINADAHKPEDLDGNYKTALETLRAAGYDEMVLLEGSENSRPVWASVKL